MAAAAAVLSTAAFSLAGSSPPPTDVAEVAEAAPLIADEPLVVPDIRRQPYVFAKGLLEDAGFSWRVKGQVKGQVKGYPANVVAEQTPAPGTLVVDTGAPTLVIKLENNKNYEKRGLPKDTSPYKGTKLILWDDKDAAVEAALAPVESQPNESTDESAATENEPEAQASERPGSPGRSRRPTLSTTGCMNTTGSSPEPSSAGTRARKRWYSLSPSTTTSRLAGASGPRARHSLANL